MQHQRLALVAPQVKRRVSRSDLTPGRLCFILAEVVGVVEKDGPLDQAVTVRFPVRWHGDGFEQRDIPIDGIALP